MIRLSREDLLTDGRPPLAWDYFKAPRCSTGIIDTGAMRRVTIQDKARLICQIAGECGSFT
jgi:hypothetical protein